MVMESLNSQRCKWGLTDEHNKTWYKTKILVTSAPHTDLFIQCNALITGLGATLLQDGHPIAYASIALTDHKPLESKVRKPFHKAPQRIQSMLIRSLVRYSVGIYQRQINVNRWLIYISRMKTAMTSLQSLENKLRRFTRSGRRDISG